MSRRPWFLRAPRTGVSAPVDVLLLALLMGGCTPEPPPPSFSYRVIHSFQSRFDVLLDLQFESFASAQESEPHTVTVTEGARSEVLELEVGHCGFFPCTGPLTMEEVSIKLDQESSFHIESFACIGLDGAAYGGIDFSGYGDCEE